MAVQVGLPSACDPVGLGLIHSFARPYSNLTGVTGLRHELSLKRLELFRERKQTGENWSPMKR